MMRYHRFGFFSLTVVSMLCVMLLAGGAVTVMAQTGKGMTTVQIVGSSKIQGDDLSSGREHAVESGLVTAISRVLVEMVPTDILSSRFQVINETILSNTDQFVRDYKVLTESTHAGTYRILVQVTVNADRLADKLKRVGVNLEKKRAMRVLLCVAEKGIADLTYSYWWSGGGSGETTPAVATLARHLMEGGLRLVAERADLASGTLSPELSGPEAVALARQLQADFVITGLAGAEETPNTMGNAVRSFRGTMHLTVYRVRDGQQVAQSRQTALTAGSDADSDSREALLNAARQAAEEVLPQINTAGLGRGSGTGRVELVVEGTGGNIANFVKLRGALSTMSGVDSVQLKEMRADAAVLSVQYQGQAQALADALLLQNFDTFGINISEVGLDSVRLKLVGP